MNCWIVVHIAIVTALHYKVSGATLKCMKCDHSPLPRLCNAVTTCSTNEICYLEKVMVSGHVLYNSGCKANMQCHGVNVIGKRSGHSRSGSNIECCSSDYCNLSGLGNIDVPLTVRGPHCLAGSYLTDPSMSTQAQTCAHNQLCAVEPSQFSGATYYTQKCVDRSYCNAIHPHTTCQTGSCCDGDFCNDQCATYTTPAPTVGYAEKLRIECLSKINEGYFFDPYTNLCVLLVKSQGTYNRAQADQHCKSNGAELMTVQSQNEQDFLLEWIFSHKANDTDFWIGAQTNVSKSHVYYWPDGEIVSGPGSYNHWSGVMMGQPDDRRVHNEDCVYINDKDRYFWHDDVCSAHKTGYICELWNVTGDKIPACRHLVFDGFFYDTSTDMCVLFRESATSRYTQTTARTECAKYGATLAILDTHAKMDFTLKWIFSNHNNATDYWIGAMDTHNTSQFYWPNGQKLTYAHWGGPVFPPEVHGQPDAAYGVTNERCMYMNHEENYKWYDDVCTSVKNGYVCQYFGSSHNSTKHECYNRLTQGYFYDEASNMCVSLRSQQAITGNQARHACMAEGADTAVVDTQNKMDFIWESIYFQKLNDTDFWIGGRDPSGKNHFIWEHTSQTFVYTNWYTVAPVRPKDCSILDHIDVYRWKTADCESKIHGYICQINERTMKKCLLRPTDIIYLLDSSGSENINEYTRTKEILVNVTQRIIHQHPDVLFGAATFSSQVSTSFFLGTLSNNNIAAGIRNLTFLSGSTNLDSALKYIRTEFTSSTRTRPNSIKIAVLITDGRTNNPTAIASEAQLLHAVANVVSVGFGTPLNEAELKAMSSNGTFVTASVDNIADAITGVMENPTLNGCAS